MRVTTTTDVSIKQVPPTVFLASVHEDVTIPEIATIARNEMEQAQIDEILIRSGVLTVNEVRRARGLVEI